MTTVRLPGYAGAAGDTTAVVSFVQGNNPGVGTGEGVRGYALRVYAPTRATPKESCDAI